MPLPKNLLAVTLIAAGGLTQAGFGQGRGGGAGSTSSTGTSGTKTTLPTNTTTTPTNTTTTPTTGTNPTQLPPIYVSGRVMLDDGTPAPLGVVIERVCGGQNHAEGFTDSGGYFGVNIQFGSQSGQIAGLGDASESGGYGMHPSGTGASTSNPGTTGGISAPGGNTAASDMRLANCDLRAKLAGYRSQSVSLVDRRPMDNPDIGVLLLHRLVGPEGGGTVTASMLSVPKEAQRAFAKGQSAVRKQMVADALKYYARAVELYPPFAMAWCEMGMLQAGHGSDEDARSSFQAAIKADPKYVPAYLQLSLVEMSAHNWQALADVTAGVLKLDSFSYPMEHFFNAIANFNLGNLGAAELEARQTEKLDTRHEFVKASQLLGVILAQRHDYLGAADELRNYLKMAPNSPEAPQVRAELEQVERLTTSGMPQVAKGQ
jgi:tetratricopeptide (TPR) repeat protein